MSKLSIFRKIAYGFIPGVAGAILGTVMGMVQMAQLDRVSLTTDILPFQNYGLYSGLIIGLLFGYLSYVIFMLLYPRFQYPASAKLGAWIGAISGALICFVANVFINLSAASYDFIQSTTGKFVENSLIIAMIGAVTGLVAGYFIAEIGSRNLHYLLNKRPSI